jgi:uncharacterized protein YqeY
LKFAEIEFMTSLYERLDQAFKEAIKQQKPVVASTLRMLKTAIRYREVELKRQLTAEELQATIATQAKQRRESVAEYTKAGRPDLAKKEEEELSVLLSFLPPQLTHEECEAELSVIEEFGSSGQDLGKVMKGMARLSGRADGKMIQDKAATFVLPISAQGHGPCRTGTAMSSRARPGDQRTPSRTRTHLLPASDLWPISPASRRLLPRSELQGTAEPGRFSGAGIAKARQAAAPDLWRNLAVRLTRHLRHYLSLETTRTTLTPGSRICGATAIHSISPNLS